MNGGGRRVNSSRGARVGRTRVGGIRALGTGETAALCEKDHQSENMREVVGRNMQVWQEESALAFGVVSGGGGMIQR